MILFLIGLALATGALLGLACMILTVMHAAKKADEDMEAELPPLVCWSQDIDWT